MTTSNRRSLDQVREFVASAKLSESLQQVLMDLVELNLQGKQAHWNLVGTNFRDLHLHLDVVVDIAREASDTIAERMRALNSVPDGRTDTVVASTTHFRPCRGGNTARVRPSTWLPTASTPRSTLCGRCMTMWTEADPSTADLLHSIIDSLEKAAWMLKSENRKV